MDTVGFTPAAVVHAPLTVATVALVVKGKVRAVPLTLVMVTVGAAVWIVIALAPLLPTLLAVSVWVAVTLYVPFDASGLENVYVQAPAVQGEVPFSEFVPVTPIATVAVSPAVLPHAPPTVVAVVFVVNGNVRTAPFTDVSVTTGAVRSTVRVWAPVVPAFAAVSVCVAVIEYAPSADNAVVGV